MTLDDTWVLKVPSAGGVTYPSRWTGTGKILPGWGHFLIVGMA